MMQKRRWIHGMTILFINMLLALVLTSAFAETCPSVTDIKKEIFHGWKIYYTDNKTLLSPKDMAAFKKHAEKFLLAEWIQQKKGFGHCYYGDQHGSVLQAFLAKDKLTPTNPTDYWYKVTGSLQCAAGTKKCQFQEKA